jgi:signal transduction histidine kinase/CheY-like chemotaxis protein
MILGNKKKVIAELKQKLADLEAENKYIRNIIDNAGIDDSPFTSLPVLSKIIDINKIGYWIKDKKSNDLWLSQTALEILGFKSDKTITWETFKNTILPEDRLIFEKVVNELQPGSKSVELELKIARSEGDSREFRLILLQITFYTLQQVNTEKIVLIGSMKDITRQDKLKRDLIKAKEKAEDSEKLKNTLLTNISHEIRTPMNSIIGFSELLQIGNLTYDQRQEYVNTIKTQGLRLLKMIDDVVELIKIETGKITIRKSPCNIDLLLNELVVVFNQYKVSQNKENLEIKINYPEKRGVIIFTDSGRLQQVISHLINNSIKFTEKGYVEIGYRPTSEQRIEFYVKDTGIGLSRDLQKNIFSRFAEEETPPGKLEGPGLGLTISKNLVKLLGGKIWVDSEPGHGSTFYFTVPYEEVPETYHRMALEEELEIPSYKWKDKVILIVEDDEVNVKFLEAVLQDTTVQILHASNGVQAVELCKSISKIDLVLMDIKMPEMDGFEATRQIRTFNDKVPIIAQTAFISESYLEKCREAGCNDQITKPIEIKTFLEKVDGFLKER